MITINGTVRDYDEYMANTTELVAEGKTSGHNQEARLVEFTALNLRRMERLNKTIALEPMLETQLQALTTPQIWYVIAEAWCGDCAQNLPAIGKIAAGSGGKIELRIIDRDDNPEWMDKYQTGGSRSIPKLIAFDHDGNELFTWGPRPHDAQMILKAWKANPGTMTHDDFERDLHTWYTKDKTKSLQNELLQLLMPARNRATVR